MIKKLFLGTFGIALNVVIYVLIVLFAIRVVTYSYQFSYQVFGNVAVSENSQEVVPVQIPDGASTDEVAAQLKKKGLIEDERAFIVHTALTKYSGLIQPGSYELSPSMTMNEILSTITGISLQSEDVY